MAKFSRGISGFGGVVLVFSVAVGVMCLFGKSDAVQTNLDSINVDKYLQNTQLVEEHMRCLIYSGLFYTYRYTGITTTRCGVCTPEQEAKLNKIAQHWQQHYPLAWRELTNFIAQG